MQERIQWQTVRAAQRHADPALLSRAGALALTAALHLVDELGPYVVGERVVRERIRAALALCPLRSREGAASILHLAEARRGA